MRRKTEIAARDQFRVEQLEGARGRIAGVLHGLLAVFNHGVIDFLKMLESQEHLAPDLEGTFAADRQRDRPDSADVGGDVVAKRAVSARYSLNQRAIVVQKGRRDAVDLQLADESDFFFRQEPPHAGHPFDAVGFVVGVFNAHHGDAVLNFCELLREVAGDPLRR